MDLTVAIPETLDVRHFDKTVYKRLSSHHWPSPPYLNIDVAKDVSVGVYVLDGEANDKRNEEITQKY